MRINKGGLKSRESGRGPGPHPPLVEPTNFIKHRCNPELYIVCVYVCVCVFLCLFIETILKILLKII